MSDLRCPVCGAGLADLCRTKTGRIASETHRPFIAAMKVVIHKKGQTNV